MYKVLGRGVTTDRQLNAVGKKLFKSRWLGVHPVDVKKSDIKPKSKGSSYFIINVDHSFEPGSHWMAVIHDAAANKYHIYDSFARRLKKLIPHFIKTIGYDYIGINKKSDQKNSESNCGALSMSILLTAAKYGINAASRV